MAGGEHPTLLDELLVEIASVLEVRNLGHPISALSLVSVAERHLEERPVNIVA